GSSACRRSCTWAWTAASSTPPRAGTRRSGGRSPTPSPTSPAGRRPTTPCPRTPAPSRAPPPSNRPLFGDAALGERHGVEGLVEFGVAHQPFGQHDVADRP